MSRNLISTLLVVFLVASVLFMLAVIRHGGEPAIAQVEVSQTEMIKLPAPRLDGKVSVEKALSQRRSVRTYKDQSLTLAEVSQILWAAQGITDPKGGKRTAPSAMASYFLELYLISGNVTDLSPGMYKYRPEGHELEVVAKGDIKTKLFEAAGQAPIKNAPAVLIIAGDSERSKIPSWMYLEAGHAAQNVYLQAVPLNLGTVVMAGFKPEEVIKALNMPKGEEPIYIMPVGKK
jgi:SagB-type dehydrogenase family enzyme